MQPYRISISNIGRGSVRRGCSLDPQIETIPPFVRDPLAFRMYLSGPFFDNGFKYFRYDDGSVGYRTGHGVDTHLLQRDFLRKIIDEAMGPQNANRFYQAISTHSDGLILWDFLFDTFADNPTSPEFLGQMMDAISIVIH